MNGYVCLCFFRRCGPAGVGVRAAGAVACCWRLERSQILLRCSVVVVSLLPPRNPCLPRASPGGQGKGLEGGAGRGRGGEVKRAGTVARPGVWGGVLFASSLRRFCMHAKGRMDHRVPAVSSRRCVEYLAKGVSKRCLHLTRTGSGGLFFSNWAQTKTTRENQEFGGLVRRSSCFFVFAA